MKKTFKNDYEKFDKNMKTIGDIIVINSKIIMNLMNGDVDSQTSAVLVQHLTLQLKCIETQSLEQRITELEKKLNN